MAGVTKIPQKVASHHRNQTPTPWSLPPCPPPPPKKPSRWLKRKNPSLHIIIGRSGTSPDDQAHWQPLRFFTFILSSRKAAVSTRRKRHDSIFTSLLKSRPVGPLPRRHRQTQPCRLASSNAPITVHACSFDALVARISSSAGMTMQPSRRRRHRVGPPCPPFVPCCARSPPSPTLRWRRLFLCLAPSRLCRPSQKGNRKSPKRGPARTRSRRGNPSSLGRYHPGADRNPRPLAVDTAHPAGRKPVRSRQRSLSNFCPHGTRELLDRRGVAAASQ